MAAVCRRNSGLGVALPAPARSLRLAGAAAGQPPEEGAPSPTPAYGRVRSTSPAVRSRDTR